MQKQNLSEYDFVRRELAALRNCITTYMGFVMGGSGVVYFGTAILNKASYMEANTAYVFVISAFIITLVLYILFYKFNSHNRHSGYCILLNQEKYESDKKVDQYLSWEVCMNILREMDENKELRDKKTQLLEDDGIYKDIKAKINSIYEGGKSFFRTKRGAGLLIDTFKGKGRSKSWNFPLYVVAVFFTIEALFMSSAVYYFCIQSHIILFSFQTISMLIITLAQMFIWSFFLKRLYDLMEGKRTIDSYCWRFLLARYDYIKRSGGAKDYTLITF